MARRLVVEVLSDASKFDKGIDQADRKIKGFEDSTKRADSTIARFTGKLDAAATAFKGIAAAAAGAVVAKFVKDSTQAAIDLNETINAVEKTFEDASDTIIDFGENSARSAGLSQRAFQELAVPIGSLLRNFGFDAQEAADATIQLTQRAADLASVFNVDVSEALGAIQAALRGEGDPIERFGANVSAARVEAFALAEGLAATKGEIDDQIKIQARLGLILQDTERFAGDFADTSGEAANSIKILQAELEDLQAQVGQGLLEPLVVGLRSAGLAMIIFRAAVNGVSNAFDETERAFNSIQISLDRFRLTSGSLVGRELDAFVAILNDLPIDARASEEVLLRLADAVGISADQIDILLDSGAELPRLLGVTASRAQRETVPALEALRDRLNLVAEEEQEVGRFASIARIGIEQIGNASSGAAPETQLLADSLSAISNAIKEQASPIFAAAAARQRLATAEDNLQKALKEGSDEEVARARLSVIEATVDADLAAASLAETYEQSLGAIQDISGDTEEDLLDLLRVLGVLDEFGDIEFAIRARLELIDRSAAGIGGAAAFIREQDRNGPLGTGVTNNVDVTINAPGSDAAAIENAALRALNESLNRLNAGVVGG